MFNTPTRRWAAILLLAMMAFAQASLAVAACAMDRAMLGSAMEMSGPECEACDTPVSGSMVTANQCVAHCTADLQQVGEPNVLPHRPAAAPMVWLRPAGPPPQVPGLVVSPPGKPPHRVLLHSFLI